MKGYSKREFGKTLVHYDESGNRIGSTKPTFGSGVILSVTPTGSDTLLEIAFDNVGTKKIMANYAKLTF